MRYSCRAMAVMTVLCPLVAMASPAASPPTSAAPAAAGEDLIPSGEQLGFPRTVPFAFSASRDAPGFGLAMAPRGIRTAAGEFGFAALRKQTITVRPGFYGLLELEGNESAGIDAWPSQQIHFWRGAFAFQVAVASNAAGRKLCERCVLEGTVRFRHESEHYTGANGGGQAIDYSDRPIFGDALVFDGAAAFRAQRWAIIARILDHVFLPGRSSYSQGPGVDVHVRYLATPRWQPFLSGYGEYLFGTERASLQYPDAYLLRALVGVAVPSQVGTLMVFFSGDVGHRKGLAAYTREATLGFGVRLAFGTLPEP